MSEFYEMNTTEHRPWKKALCVLLSLIIAFGTFVTLTFGSSRFQHWLGIKSMLSAYASEIVDTKGAIAVNEEAMLNDSNIIDLKNNDGSNTVYLFSEPISYTDENGKLKTKDISVEKQGDKELKAKGYGYTNGQNDYRINFSTDSSKGLYIEFGESSYSIIPQSDSSAVGNESTSEILTEQFEDFEYKNIYGEGTNLKFYPQLNGVKDEIVLNSNIGKNVFSFKLVTSNCTAVLNDDGTVSLISSDDKESVQTFSAPFAYDSEYIEGDKNEHYIDCSYTLDKIDDNTYIMSVNVDKAWLESESTAYPVTIDPTTSHIGNMYDLPIHKNRTTTGATVDVNAVGYSAEHIKSCSLIKFQKPSEIKRYAAINSAYYYTRELTGRTSSFKCGVHQIKGSWNEKTVWSTCPAFDKNYSSYRNINSASKDVANNPYWYKFNLKSLVQKWYTGTTNYGFMLRYESDSTAYNLRTFAHLEYSTSAMRPYTVINYTNDTTAPTATVSRTPTSWTNENVTVKISNAKDNSGGAGLHSSPYSFSKTSGSYSWGATASKAYSGNTTVYASVRDAASPSNIKTYPVKITNIDKLDPKVPAVTGNPSGWTNKDVTLTVKSSDAAATSESGKSGVKYYCYTKTKGVYGTWKSVEAIDTSTTFTITSNGTYYFYSKDQAGNISAPKAVTVNIDKGKPVISDISVIKDTDKNQTTVTITASDDLSGIAGYSFDGKEPYLPESSQTLDTVSNTISVAVKDNAGNIATQVSEPILPEFYTDGNLVGILNPNIDSNEKLQYKIGENGEWTDYTAPFAPPLNQTSTIYARVGDSDAVIIKDETPTVAAIGAYTESGTDFSLAYKNISFDFVRTYNSTDKKWFFATDSNVSIVNKNVISAVLPDSTELTFIKTADNTYTNEINGYILAQNDNGYIIQIDDVNYTYDTNGKLVSISNKYEDTITIARSTSSITITDGANRTYALALDSNSNITSVTDPANNTITYTYDDNNNLTKVVDQAGVTLGQYAYTNGVLTKSMDKTVNYNSDGRVAGFVYDSGAYLNYTYDDANKTVSAESSTETATSETYNDALMVISSTDEEGNTTEYTYDDHYRTLTETSDGTTVTYTYDSNGNVVSEVSDDEEAENTYYTYDTNGNLIRQQTGSNYTYSVYNELDELTLTATLKEGYTGEIPESYSAELDCFDTVSYTYDNGMLTKTVDSKENETVTYLYDSYGNTVKTTSSKVKDNETTVGVTDCSYDIMGNMLTSVSGEDTSSYIYDKAGRTLLANDKGECTRTIYDNFGRTIQEISPEDYDSTKDGLPTANTYADSAAGQTYQYAANGTLTSETNRLGKTTKYFYNDIGAKVREEFDIYKFYYLNHGELYQVKVAGVTTVSYNYDNDFKLLSETYANDDVIRYTYNENDDVTAQYHNSNAKPYVSYTYDENGELTEKVNTDTGLKYVYGADNKVDVYKTSDNTLVQSYTETETEADEENNIEAKTDITETHFGTSYSSVVKDKSISYTTGNNTIAYSYQTTDSDEGEKVSSDTVKNGDTDVISAAYTYDDNGNITAKDYSYKYLSHAGHISIKNEYDKDGKITASGYDDVFNYYTYDENDQLIRSDNNVLDYTVAFTYDNRGNILSKNKYRYGNTTGQSTESTTFEYANSGWKDQLIKVNDEELTYDANGNVLTYGNKEYTWNTGRNLESITDGDNTYSYTYDENGIRTSKTVNGVTTYYNTRDGVILSQTDGTNTMYFQYDTEGTPLGFIYNGTQYFYLTNQMDDVISIADAQGNELVQYEYDEWGKTAVIITTDDTEEEKALADINPIRYRGYYLDSETGYYYLQSRYYDPSICRFINADIPEIAQQCKNEYSGVNLFVYCFNNSINNIDIDGFTTYYSSKNIIKYFIEDHLMVNRYVQYSKIKQTNGIYKCKVTYRALSSFLFIIYKSFEIQWGNKNNWQNYIKIKTDSNYVSKRSAMNSQANPRSEVYGELIMFIISFILVFSIDSENHIVNDNNQYVNKIWGKNGLDPSNKYGYYLFYISGNDKYSGYYAFRNNGKGFKQL